MYQTGSCWDNGLSNLVFWTLMIPTAEIHDLWQCPHVLKPPRSEPRGPFQSLDFWPISSPALRRVELLGVLSAVCSPRTPAHCLPLINLDPSSARAILLFLRHSGCNDVMSYPQITPEETRNLPRYSWLPQSCPAVPTPSANSEERVQHSRLNSCPSPPPLRVSS